METTLDDLLQGSLKIYQPKGKDGPRVNVDTILLAYFTRLRQRDRVLELGCAHGAISLILAKRRSMNPLDLRGCLIGLDIQSNLIELALLNSRVNGLEGVLSFVVEDLRNHRLLYKPQSFDVIVMNPPYDEIGKSRKSPFASRAMALHGEECSLSDVLEAAAFLLKNRGRLYLVIRSKRLGELIALLEKYNIRAKRLRLVYPKQDRPASVALVEGVRAAGKELIIEPPLVILNEEGQYTEALCRAYRLGDEWREECP